MSDQLRSIYDRWYRLEEEKQAISDDLKDLFAEAKANGYDGKALRVAFRIKAKAEGPDAAGVAELNTVVETYLNALGMASDAFEQFGTPRATRTRVARLTPSVSALPIVTAAPDLAAEESVGTDASLDDEAGAAVDPALVATTAKPATAAKEAAGTHHDVAPAIVCPEATEPRADTRTAARGNSSDDDWPEMPAFLVRTEQGRG